MCSHELDFSLKRSSFYVHSELLEGGQALVRDRSVESAKAKIERATMRWPTSEHLALGLTTDEEVDSSDY